MKIDMLSELFIQSALSHFSVEDTEKREIYRRCIDNERRQILSKNSTGFKNKIMMLDNKSLLLANRLFREIGVGAFGKVIFALIINREFLNKKLSANNLKAVKKIKINEARLSANSKCRLENEKRITKAALGECELIMRRKIKQKESIPICYYVAYFYMPYISGNNLKELLVKSQFENFQLDEIARLEIIIALCDDLQKLHSKNIVHCDIKLENCIVKKDKTWKVTIIDFGLSHFGEKIGGEVNGTPKFLSKEVIKYPYISSKARDIYAIAAIIAKILGANPFKNKNAKIPFGMKKLTKKVLYQIITAKYYFDGICDDRFHLLGRYKDKIIFCLYHMTCDDYSIRDDIGTVQSTFKEILKEIKEVKKQAVTQKKLSC